VQAALRFGCGPEIDETVVVAHTAALREDLLVVAEGDVAKTYSAGAKRVAEVVADLRGSFTTADVRERLAGEPNPRDVRRQLAALIKAGHLDRTETPNGVATQFSDPEAPGAGQVELLMPVTHTRTTRRSVYPIRGLSGWVVTPVVHDTVRWHAPRYRHQTRPQRPSRVIRRRRNRRETPDARRSGRPRLARFCSCLTQQPLNTTTSLLGKDFVGMPGKIIRGTPVRILPLYAKNTSERRG